jgi:outer membrane PBP1 activator LpoA protein
MPSSSSPRPSLADRLRAIGDSLIPLLAALALTACAADVPETSPFSFQSTHHRSLP